METLPNLLLGRKYHGCASFVQNGKKVSINYYLKDDSVFTPSYFLLLFLFFLFRFFLSLVDGVCEVPTQLVIMTKQRSSKVVSGET